VLNKFLISKWGKLPSYNGVNVFSAAIDIRSHHGASMIDDKKWIKVYFFSSL
jgi:hypothetical protein